MVVVVLPTPPFWLAIAITRGTGCGRVSSGFAEFISPQFYRGQANQRGIRTRATAWAIVDSAKNVPRGTSGAEMEGLGSKYVPRGTMRPAQAWLGGKPQAFPDLYRPSGLGFQAGVRSPPRIRPV